MQKRVYNISSASPEGEAYVSLGQSSNIATSLSYIIFIAGATLSGLHSKPP
jgi:hypothetical protein